MLGLIGFAGMLALVGAAGASTARSEGFTATRACGGASLGTCASAQASSVGRDVALRLPGRFRGSADNEYRVQLGSGGFGPAADQAPLNPTDRMFCPQFGEVRSVADCASVTVTPEPVSMTLLATGLAGIMAVHRRRQRNMADGM